MAFEAYVGDAREEFYFSRCWKCNCWLVLPKAMYDIARQRGNGMTVFCPNGHGGVFSPVENETDKLRRERDQLTQRLAQRDDHIRELNDQREAAERRVSAAKGQITKIKKRAANGVCPCCNRTFSDLARHMAGKHPGYVKEPTADELVTVN